MNSLTSSAPSLVLDAQGRAVERIPGLVLNAILVLDDALANFELKWNVVCGYCQQAGHPQPYARPERIDGRLELVCPHARRIARVD